MENINPATPPQSGANPGQSGQGQASPAQPNLTPGQGEQGESVMISAKEYAELTRNNARLKAFQQRAQFTPKSSNFMPSEKDDPEIIDALHKEQETRQKLELDLRSERIKNGVREILEKDAYKGLPKVAKDLILKNPALLSKAETVEEALIDIEEFVGTQAADYKAGSNQEGLNQQQGGVSRPQSPAGHETPPIVNAANPAPVNVDALEDVDKLEGQSKSRAILRNVLKKARQGKGV